jgi:hypothetical protein
LTSTLIGSTRNSFKSLKMGRLSLPTRTGNVFTNA